MAKTIPVGKALTKSLWFFFLSCFYQRALLIFKVCFTWTFEHHSTFAKHSCHPRENLQQPTVIFKGKGKHSKGFKNVSELFHPLTSATCALSSVVTQYRKQDLIKAVPLPNEWDLVKTWHAVLIQAFLS